MRYFALATDYDGTLARGGKVDPRTVQALRRVVASGRRLLLVTGRELEDLQSVFPELDVFDYVVAENGALLFKPSSGEINIVAEPVDPEFANRLMARKLQPLDIGRVLMATRRPNEVEVLKVIQDLGLEMQVIFNREAVMLLPSGVNKATGLQKALEALELSPHNVIGIGDAENDHAFLELCEISAAVGNALPAVKQRADFTTRGEDGAGVRETISALLEDDLAAKGKRIQRHALSIGQDRHGRDVAIPSFGGNLLFAGPSGSGKSRYVKTFIERLADSGYQFCVIDPEGDYEDFEEGVVLGDRSSIPSVGEVMQVLKTPGQNALVNLLGVALQERPAYFASLLAELAEMRSRNGRPHWIIVDEAHHVLPQARPPGSVALPHELHSMAFLTVEPESMLPEVVQAVDTLVAVGEAANTVEAFARAAGQKKPAVPKRKLEKGQGLFWRVGLKPRLFTVTPTRFDHQRHRRKYAEGDLGEVESFYFRGPEEKLNLKAQNLIIFSQIAEGLDDETWQFHLANGDYTRWFRAVIKDPELADLAAPIEKDRSLSPADSRKAVRDAIAQRYTLPAEQASGITQEAPAKS